jgi:hypothetical protein
MRSMACPSWSFSISFVSSSISALKTCPIRS